MNQEQLANLLRMVVTAVCGWLAAQGYSMFGDSALVVQIASAVVAVGAAVWTVVSHTNAAKLQSAAAVDPGVKITVPASVMKGDSKIDALVKNTDVPNVVAVKPGL
jgi:hypothetical protein